MTKLLLLQHPQPQQQQQYHGRSRRFVGSRILLLFIIFGMIIETSAQTLEEDFYSNSQSKPTINSCTTTMECQETVHPLSVCLTSGDDDDRICSIPNLNSLEQGCFYNKMPGWKKKLRVCNSDDVLPAAVDMGLCRLSDYHFDYLEIRIKCQDWESVLFGAWILQIILSEILDIPTTLETGKAETSMQFYDTSDRFEYGTTSNNLLAFENAAVLAHGDCRKLQQPPKLEQQSTDMTSDDNTYLNCAHVIPEVWTARSEQVLEYMSAGILDPPLSLGALGIEGWYIPKQTATVYPMLTSWIGLQQNRELLAELFLRPMKWKDYCTLISVTNCRGGDNDDNTVAQRPPNGEWEENRLFVDGLYTGYFQSTVHNNCTQFPMNCTGHIGDFPCGWGGSLEAQCYHLNIGLESNGDEPYSGGYTYSQLGEMWRAANATNNHVAMMWAIPDPIYEEFQGTEYEFVKITLPAPTQTCIKNRINAEYRCDPDRALRLGPPEGVCDENARPLYKLLLKDLFELTEGSNIPIAKHSPAYQVISQFSLTELQINEMFSYWQTINSTSWTPRDAICQWTIDNFDTLQQYIPRTFPRTIQDSIDVSTSTKPLFYVTTILGGLASLLVFVTTIMVYHFQERRVFRYAQIEFLYLLLAGSACVSIGAILTGLLHPSNASCTSQVWLIGLGYTLEMVPLLVKVAAINRLMMAAQRMRRVKLQRSSLRGGVAFISLLVSVFLLVWTILDPPKREAEYELTDQIIQETDYFDTTIVHVRYFCTSQSEFWQYISVAWNLVLILCATALAFQSRSVQQDFNEAQILSRLIYAHFMFVLIRVMSFFFPPSVKDPMLSIIFSLDTIVMILVYFLPKFLADDTSGVIGGQTSSRISGLGNTIQPSSTFLPPQRTGSRVTFSGFDGASDFQSDFDGSSHRGMMTQTSPRPPPSALRQEQTLLPREAATTSTSEGSKNPYDDKGKSYTIPLPHTHSEDIVDDDANNDDDDDTNKPTESESKKDDERDLKDGATSPRSKGFVVKYIGKP